MAIKHDLPPVLYVRLEEDLEGEPLVLAEKTLEDSLPEDARPATVGMYQLVKVLKVAKTVKVLAEEEIE